MARSAGYSATPTDQLPIRGHHTSGCCPRTGRIGSKTLVAEMNPGVTRMKHRQLPRRFLLRAIAPPAVVPGRCPAKYRHY